MHCFVRDDALIAEYRTHANQALSCYLMTPEQQIVRTPADGNSDVAIATVRWRHSALPAIYRMAGVTGTPVPELTPWTGETAIKYIAGRRIGAGGRETGQLLDDLAAPAIK